MWAFFSVHGNLEYNTVTVACEEANSIMQTI